MSSSDNQGGGDDDGIGDADKPVGYCSPPYEYRWAPGYCPNPKGRPKRKKTMDETAPLNAFQHRVLEHATKVVMEIDGRSITNLDKLLLQLSTSDNPADRKLLLSHYEAAIAADRAFREEAVEILSKHKAYWGPIFDTRRKAGLALPEVYPDPDDIVIRSPIEYRLLGPASPDQARDWERMRKAREGIFMIAREFIESAGWTMTIEKARAVYDRFRRMYYRYSRHLPEAFKKKHPAKFPAFKPPAEPPEWYRGYDEWKDENGEWVRSDPIPRPV